MNKQELLTKLATECATWGEADKESHEYARLANDICFLIYHEDWLAERERLLNKTSWDCVDNKYAFSAIDSDGVRFLYVREPRIWGGEEVWDLPRGMGDDVIPDHSQPIAIPAGYDWKQSLEARPA